MENVLVKLRSFNYLNDESLRPQLGIVESSNHGYGPKRIEQELRAKGIGQTTIREIVHETFKEEDEETCAKRLLTRRFTEQNLQDAKVMRRAVGLPATARLQLQSDF